MNGYRAVLCLALGFWSAAVLAERSFTVRLSGSGPGDTFAEQVQALSGDAWRARHEGGAFTLALGDAAFKAALDEPGHGPVLGVAITRSLAAAQVKAGCRCSAIWKGVPLQHQLRVLHAMLPAARKVGILLGPGSAWEPPEPSMEGMQLRAVWVSDPQRLGPQLRSRLPGWDALLLPVDGTLFGAGDAKLILLTSYRQRVPVFGPGAGYVHAGSVASAYTSTRDMARAALAWLSSWQSRGAPPAAGFAGHYSLAVNEHVAGAYDLLIQDLAGLQRALESTP